MAEPRTTDQEIVSTYERRKKEISQTNGLLPTSDSMNNIPPITSTGGKFSCHVSNRINKQALAWNDQSTHRFDCVLDPTYFLKLTQIKEIKTCVPKMELEANRFSLREGE